MKYIDRINQQISVQENATEVKLPAMEMKLMNMISMKADNEKVTEMLEAKEDKTFTEQIHKRLMDVEEHVKKLNQIMAPEEDEPDDAVKEADADGAEVKKAPTSKKMTVSMEQFEALRHKVDKNEIDLIHKIGKL